MDPRRVRIGLIILVAVLGVALATAVVINDPLGRAIMLGIVVFTTIRAFLLVRSLRRGQ